MKRCVTYIKFGTEGQEIKCFSRKKMKHVSTMLNCLVAGLVAKNVSLSCLSWMRWAMKVLNWTKLVRRGPTLVRHIGIVVVVVPWIIAVNVATRIVPTMIMTRLKEALWLWHDSSQSCGWTIFENSFRFCYTVVGEALAVFPNWRLTKNCQFFADDCNKSSEFSLVMTGSICRLTEMAGRTIIFIRSRNG